MNKCIFNIEMVTDEMEKSFAQTHLDQSGFDAFKAELGPSTNSTLKRDYSMDVSYDEQDVLNRVSKLTIYKGLHIYFFNLIWQMEQHILPINLLCV